MLEGKLHDVTSELTNKRTDMESKIKKHVETEESLKELNDELQKQLKTKNLALERVNKDLNTEIARITQVENQFHETQEKLHEQLAKKQSEYDESVGKIESENTELKVQNNETSKLLKEKEILLKDIHTSAKKNMQRISSLTALQSDYIRDQIVESFKDSQNHIKSIALIHEKLYESPDLENINFAEYVKSLVDDLCISHEVDTNRISADIHVKNVFLDIDTATSCGLIINELVSNSIKHAFPNDKQGIILIEIEKDDNGMEMIVSDNGIGLSERVNFDEADTLGLQLVKILVGESNGKIEFKDDNGTKYKINFKKDANLNR